MPRRFKTSWRSLWLIGLVGIIAGVWFAMRFTASPPVRVTKSAEAIVPVTAVALPDKTPSNAAVPSSLPAAPSRPSASPEEGRPPSSLRDLPADPFEPQGDQEPEVRTLVAVGDIQLGVLRNARVRDEAGLKTALARIGDEIDRRTRQGLQPGAPGLQELLDSHREELGRYVDGEVELRGPDWMIGLEAGQPRPLDENWRPRPN